MAENEDFYMAVDRRAGEVHEGPELPLNDFSPSRYPTLAALEINGRYVSRSP
jgi:hypothetical protein